MRPVQQFVRYAIPSVIAMWVFSIYTMADGIFVARGVGETALAAVNIAMPFINGIFAVSLWLAVGASTLIAMALGSGDQKRANGLFTMNIVVLTLLSIVITLLAYTHLDQLASFLGATELTQAYVKDYLRIIILFSGCFIVSYCLEVLVKTDGFPVLATVGVSISALANIILDYFMVIRWGWGVQGAALATGIAQLALLVIFLFHFISRRSTLAFTRFDCKLLSNYKRILPIGFSDCITEFSTGLVTFMFNRQGVIVIEREDVDEDQLMEDALEAGAADFLTDDTDIFEIRTEPNDVGAVRDELEGKGYKILSSEPAYIPTTYTRLESQDDMMKMARMIEMFEDNDDVQNIWHNWENEDEYEG